MYPNLHLDLYPYCNAKCVFCSYHKKTRAANPMPNLIFEKVVLEIGASDEPVEVMPYYYGETLMNPKLFEQCKFIQSHAPECTVSLSTNGVLLTDDAVKRISELENIKFINFSLYAGTKETYSDIIGLDYDKVVGRVSKAISTLSETRPDMRLCVGSTSDTRFVPSDKDRESLVSQFGDLVSFHTISFNSQHCMPTMERTEPSRDPCANPFVSVVVYNDGKVGLCVFDVNGDLTIGDVTKTTLLEAVYSDIAQKYRHVHSCGCRDVIPLCRSCTQPR